MGPFFFCFPSEIPSSLINTLEFERYYDVYDQTLREEAWLKRLVLPADWLLQECDGGAGRRCGALCLPARRPLQWQGQGHTAGLHSHRQNIKEGQSVQPGSSATFIPTAMQGKKYCSTSASKQCWVFSFLFVRSAPAVPGRWSCSSAAPPAVPSPVRTLQISYSGLSCKPDWLSIRLDFLWTNI